MRYLLFLFALVVVSLKPSEGAAFSVLAHQAVIDDTWENTLAPTLRQRFPRASGEELERARAFAYGGSHVPDLGYFPFGNELFTDLVHYVRSGDFIDSLVAEAQTLDEYAFALGVLSHYVTDNTGHPEATNRVVPELYPDLRQQYGDTVTYADDKQAHRTIEFRFDVLQVGHSKTPPDLFKHAVGFEVAKPVLERAFVKTYGLHLDDLFADTDIAITTYRWGFRTFIHEVTGIAWQLYRAEQDPTIKEDDFVFSMSRGDFEQQFGKAFREPGYFARIFAFFVKLVPNIGPFKKTPERPLPEDVQQRFVQAIKLATQRYRAAIAQLTAKHARLAARNLDTGEVTQPGQYELTDAAYFEWLKKLDQHHFADATPEVRADILHFYEADRPPRPFEDDDDERDFRRALAHLKEGFHD